MSSKFMNLNQHQIKKLHQITFVATFGGLLFGYDTGVINGAFTSLKSNMGLTVTTEGLVMSVLLVGAAIGSILGGRCADLFGRRKYLLSLSAFFLVGAFLSALSPNLEILLFARFILGFAIGGASVTAPTFISEVAPTEMRGKLTGLNEVAISMGVLLAFTINTILFYLLGHLSNVWRYMLIVQALPALGLLIGMWRAPESPRWLLSKGRREEALSILKQIRPEERAIKEYNDIITLIDEEKKIIKNQTGVLSMLKTPWIFKIVLVGIIFAALQQTTGVNVIMYYGTEILSDVGFSETMALTCNILNGICSVAGMLIGVLILVDRMSRKNLIIGGFFLMATMHLIIAAVDHFVTGESKPILIWLLGALFVIFMQGSMGFITWVVLVELFPLKIRGFALGISVFSMWIMNAVVAYLFPLLKDLLGLGAVFLIFAVINYLAIIFVKVLLPETSKKSLEQLEEEFSTGKW